ncbi:MAG: DUF5998 family protein [Bifidobacteriaceae bacterium]|jgi:hypothetical protein|nr:DUF5998 family protein [Bifidobacteriaceae bacterium]
MLQDQALQAELDQTGYFPQIVADALDIALAGEAPTAFYVHPDVAFGIGTIGRHLTVMVLTETRLISAHVDDHAGDEVSQAAVAASTEAVALRRIESVNLTRITSDPAEHSPGDPPGMVRLSVCWGGNQILDFEPAECPDPECTADHGYTGSLSGEDMGLQAMSDINGEDVAAKLVEFAGALYAATARVA